MHEDKREYYDLMGWCQCSKCKQTFEDYEEYEQHVCDHNLRPSEHSISWSVI